MKLSKSDITKHADNILIEYKNNNNDIGFFSDIREIYFPLKGIKFISTCENINYTFQEVDYFLLENKKVARFTNHYTNNSCYRKLLDIFSITAYKKEFKKRNSLNEFLKLEEKLVTT